MTELPLLRTSERGSFKRCPQRWWWGTIEGWGPGGPPDIKLWFGTGWHALMAYWYQPGEKRGKEPLKFWRDWIGDETAKIRVNLSGNDEWKEEVYIEAGTLGELMWGNYMDTYGRDESMWFVETEHVGQVTVLRKGTKNPMLWYSFTYDGVYIDQKTGKMWLIEHKTAKAIMTAHLDLDDQAGSYWAVAPTELKAAKLMKASQNLAGIMYNFARKSPPSDKPRNAEGLTTNLPKKEHFINALTEAKLGYDPRDLAKMSLAKLDLEAAENSLVVLGEVSATQPAKLLLRHPVYRTRYERNKQITKIQDEYEVMEKYKTGELALIKNPTKDCSWDCSFYDACLLHERGGDVAEYMDAAMVKGDPYEPYRKSASVTGDM